MNEKDLEKTIKAKLQAFYTQGLKDGSKAICGVVINKLNQCNEETTREEMLSICNDLRNFCKVSLGSKRIHNDG